VERSLLAKKIQKLSRLNGNFVLRSGKRTNLYFDKYRFESSPKVLRAVTEHLYKLIPKGTEVLAGLELGGIPIAVDLSQITGLPTVFVRKEPKTYGTSKLAEGAEINGKTVLIIEDIITTGGQVVSSVKSLRELGAIIDSVLCVVDRKDGSKGNLEEADLKIISLFTSDDLEPISKT
jgi:orotate phosphoribosyltransferase